MYSIHNIDMITYYIYKIFPYLSIFDMNIYGIHVSVRLHKINPDFGFQIFSKCSNGSFLNKNGPIFDKCFDQ